MKKRCDWPGDNRLMIEYHDAEWGVPLHDDRKLFEFLLLDNLLRLHAIGRHGQRPPDLLLSLHPMRLIPNAIATRRPSSLFVDFKATRYD